MAIEVFINQAADCFALNFYIVDRDQMNNRMFLLRFGKYNTTLEEISSGAAIVEPTFRLGVDQGQQFLKQIAELAAKRGIKTDPDLKREGKVEAMEAHLLDMRKLVFGKFLDNGGKHGT